MNSVSLTLAVSTDTVLNPGSVNVRKAGEDSSVTKVIIIVKSPHKRLNVKCVFVKTGDFGVI